MIILHQTVQLQNRQIITFHAPDAFIHDPVANRYQALFDRLDWSELDNLTISPAKGRLPHPESAYIKAFLVMIAEKFCYITDLHRFLCDHPALIWVIGFRLVPLATSPYGFNIRKTVPCDRHLRRKLAQLDRHTLEQLLKQTVQQFQHLYPDLGEVVSLDTKHIYAHVQENNPKQFVTHRYDPKTIPKGDPTCRLGLKRRHNQKKKQTGQVELGKAEWLWGYASGVATTILPNRTEIVLADYTQTLNCNDITYAKPLLTHLAMTIGNYPRHVVADAAFDASWLYEYCAKNGGMAIIPFNQRNKRGQPINSKGEPTCCQEVMKFAHWESKIEQKARFICQKCQKNYKMNLTVGNMMRLTLNRDDTVYKNLYKQRTAVERINSQATALGIERPKQRRLASIARRNRLIYILINLHALQRTQKQSIKIHPP